MDGTIYLENDAFDFAIKFINKLRAHGKRVMFYTNNASRTSQFYLEKLRKLGFEATSDEIMTSGDVLKVFLKRYRQDRTVYMVAMDELCEEYKRDGIALVSNDGESADIVVTSFDMTLTYEKLKHACRYIRGGAEYLSTHPDKNCPTKDGFIPDSGAISAFVTESTGVVPKYFGKPYAETLEMIEEATGYSREEMCIFGDRLYTDIALGKSLGVTSVLVLSGETKLSDVEAADLKDRPDYVVDSLADVDAAMFDKNI